MLRREAQTKLDMWSFIYFILVLGCTQSQVAKPGLKARVTQAGLDYARDVAINVLLEELAKVKIPNVSESAGPAHLDIQNIKILSFDRPTSNIGIEPGIGLRWTANNLNPRLQANYIARVSLGWLKMTKVGTITVTGRDMSFDMQFFIGREIDGKPSVSVSDCSAAGDVVLSFRGGFDNVLNLMSGTFKKNIRSLVRAQICFQAKKEINEQAAWALSRFPVTQDIFDGFLLDYQLTRFPQFSPDYLEAYIKGQIRHSSDTQEPPFQPPTIPSRDSHVVKMVYVYVTDYLANSGLQSAYNVGKLRISVGRDTESPIPIPEEVFQYFRTTCPNSACLGTIFPQVAVAYPNAAVEVDAFATQAPWLTIHQGALALDASIQADLFAVDDRGRHPLFSVHSNVSSELVVQLSGKRVMFNVTEIEPEIVVSGAMVEDPGTGFFFEAIARLAVQQALRPKLAEIGGKGIELPDLNDVTFVDPQVMLSESNKGVLVVATDISYDKSSA